MSTAKNTPAGDGCFIVTRKSRERLILRSRYTMFVLELWRTILNTALMDGFFGIQSSGIRDFVVNSR